MTAFFVSGPHGCGKTTLIEKLISHDSRFAELPFEIDFLKSFANFKNLGHWERCLVRLYHRSYLTALAHQLPGDQIYAVSRGIRDSEAYIRAYACLGWISPEETKMLSWILENPTAPTPTVLLLPPLETVLSRLYGRREQGVRRERDAIFNHEDGEEFTAELWRQFAAMAQREDVLVLEDNEDDDIQKLMEWLKGIEHANRG